MFNLSTFLSTYLFPSVAGGLQLYHCPLEGLVQQQAGRYCERCRKELRGSILLALTYWHFLRWICVCAFCFLQQAIFAVISVAPDGIRLSEDILARAIVSFYTSQKLVPAGISQEAQRIGRRKWALACGSARQSSGGCGLRHRTMPRPKL